MCRIISHKSHRDHHMMSLWEETRLSFGRLSNAVAASSCIVFDWIGLYWIVSPCLVSSRFGTVHFISFIFFICGFWRRISLRLRLEDAGTTTTSVVSCYVVYLFLSIEKFHLKLFLFYFFAT